MSLKVENRRVAKALGCLSGICLIVMAALGPSTTAMALTKVKAGHLVALDMAPLFVGKESGCFEKAGLDVETIFFANPGDNNAALAGGSIDFSTNPFTLPFFAANSGVPIRVISGAGGWGIIEVIAQKKVGLKSIADIKSYAASGKQKLKIATLQGDTLELILTRTFAKAGIDTSSVELVYFNDLLAMVEAFRSGQVDILSHIKPYTTEMEVEKGAALLTTDAETWTKHVRPEAEFVVSHGPVTQQERWEEVGGYSPSTIAAEIAGLVCASDIARKNGASDDADRYLKTADDWAAHIEAWMVTTTGHLGKGAGEPGYYIRIDNNTDPNDGFKLDTRNGGGVWDERDVVDAGFLEFVRLGIRSANDLIIQHSVEIVDGAIRVETPNGPSFYRYSHDGYGETYFGGPWQGEGIGRIWPIFTGERGEYEIAAGHDATPYLTAMLRFTNQGGMIPEQIWEQAEPTRAGFVFGRGTGSATPLAWSMAQFLRLVVCAEEKRIVETPAVVADHFLKSRK